MSSGFVSGGTIDNPAERDDAWHKAQEELAETRRRKEESQQHEGKSLYEVLQANKGGCSPGPRMDRPANMLRCVRKTPNRKLLKKQRD